MSSRIYSRREVLVDLTLKTEEIVTEVQTHFTELSDLDLNWKANPDSWSVAECLDHLCLYGDFYIPAMKEAVFQGVENAKKDRYKSSLIGEYFVQSMMPSLKMKKISSPKDYNPSNSEVRSEVVTRFLSQQQDTLSILESVKNIDLEGSKVGITIAPWLKLRIGDTLRFNVYHNQRHVLQAGKVLSNMKSRNPSV